MTLAYDYIELFISPSFNMCKLWYLEIDEFNNALFSA